MFGKNPIRPPSNGDGLNLNVKNIFATLQGEGFYAGHPAIFIRLGGCNLACNFCDTEFEDFENFSLIQIITKVKELANNTRLVVITGGEPFLQPIEKLCEQLINLEFKVQIETNGTLFRKLTKEVEIICSPKNSGNGYFPIRPDLLERINAFKFIVSANNKDYNNVAEIGQANNIPVYVQPMDEYNAEKNQANLKLATELALNYGYRLSLQLHKIVGIE
ncbi:MAG: 7-carboxy-7-deazaguanine synthase QueE [Pseudomonadota bacterium]